MPAKPTRPDTSLETVPSTARLYPDEVARHAGEHQAITGTMQEFLRRGLAAQLAVDEVLGAFDERELEDEAPRGRGYWVHFGRCGGELTHLQGIGHPVCTKCRKEVF